MTAPAGLVPWQGEGWRGWIAAGTGIDPARCLAAATGSEGRASRHARTVRLASDGGPLWVKSYPPPGGARARRALRMGQALCAAGFAAPAVVLAAWRGGAGLLVTRDVGGHDVATTLAARRRERAAKRALLRRLGAAIGHLHGAGFVHGDLVPPNVYVVDERFVLLDHDRTRRGRLLVCFGACRNLVQLGRFVVPGVTLADRARVLAAYADARGLSRRQRRRLGWWVVRKTTARRCAIDHVSPAAARRVGYRTLMRSGGPFDPASRAGEQPLPPAAGAPG